MCGTLPTSLALMGRPYGVRGFLSRVDRRRRFGTRYAAAATPREGTGQRRAVGVVLIEVALPQAGLSSRQARLP